MTGIPKTWQEKAEEVIRKLSGTYPDAALKELQEAQDVLDAGKALPKDKRGEEYQTTLFRLIHNLKGQGGTFGYPLITEIGNHLCRYIEQQESFEDKQNTCIQKHLTILKTIIENRLTGDGGSKGRALKDTLGMSHD